MNKNILTYLAAILYASIIGFSFLFVKIALSVSNPIDLLAYRFTFAFIVFLLFILVTRPKLHYRFAHLKRIIPVALLYPLLFFTFQTFGLESASSSEAGILLATTPVFTLILARLFLNEKTNVLQKLSLLLSVGGIIYITLMKSAGLEFNHIKGSLLLLASALSMSAYSVFAKKILTTFTNLELTFIMITISFLSFNALAIGHHLLQGSMALFFAPLSEPPFLIAILYLGVLSSLLTALLSNYVLSQIAASKMIVFSNLATVISIFAGVFILNEDFFFYHIIGSILIIMGVLGTNFFDQIHFKN